MPYFINIGRFEALKNVMGSRGWHIFRRAKIISVRWGPIEVHNGRPKRFIWAGRPPTPQKLKRSTVEAAKKEMRRRIAEKQSEGRADRPYQRLPAGQKILDMPRHSRKA
jgi:hypothetical protein